MKEKLTLRNILLCGAALAGILVFALSFLAKITFVYGDTATSYKNAIWGCDMGLGGKLGPAVLPMIGVILALVAGLCLCVMLLAGDKLVKDAKVRRIIVLVAAGLLVVGGVLLFFTKQGVAAAYAKKVGGGTTAKDIMDSWADMGMKVKTTVSVILGIGAILGGGLAAAAELLPAKK